MKIHFAPVQGHTDSAYRHFHSESYGGQLIYYTPFIRLEKGEIRSKDIKDLTNPLNENHHLIPQIIFRDRKELEKLVELIKKLGYKEIDLNMGCPFPLQTGHGRGAATIANETLAQDVIEVIEANPDVIFSVKLRLGMNAPDEWRIILPYFNKVKLDHLALHPRIAKQQYGGEVNLEEFEKFLTESKNPVVYNGDLKTKADIDTILQRFPAIAGIMIGRGLLGRPSLAVEYQEGTEWDPEIRKEKMLKFHKKLYTHYSDVLCGDTQIISKISPFWEYAEEEIGRKAWKAIKKATNVPKYQSAIAII